MRYLALLATTLALGSGCLFVFDGGRGGDDHCAFPEPGGAVAPLRNPDTLMCEGFGGPLCDPACGPCPFVAEPAPATDPVALSQPSPPWGFCGSSCETLDESACAATSECRVVKDAACAVSGDCITDFIGCFPINQLGDASVDCFEARDGFTCASSSACTAYHLGAGSSSSPAPQVSRPFAMCAPEGKSPGTCFGEVTCRAAAPACPPDSRPGVADGCYTRACIPVELCEPAPLPPL